MSDSRLKDTQDCIGYHFKDEALLERALTHSSAGTPNYERLEFLGDRVLGLVISEDIFKRFPDEKEGLLARRLNALVCRPMLADVALSLNIGRFILTQEHDFSVSNEDGSLIAENEKVLSDSIEAILGAMYLDGGLAPCSKFIGDAWGERLMKVNAPKRDPKTALQEYLQAKGLPIPKYELVAQDGPDHAPLFEISVSVDGAIVISEKSASKRTAEKSAARKMLKILHDKDGVL